MQDVAVNLATYRNSIGVVDMKKSDWWLPENLTIIEDEIAKIEDLKDLDAHGDFGSYKIMLRTNDINLSQITSHNNINPSYRVRAVKKLLGDFIPHKILDLGCGLGFTTNELSKFFPNAKVTGIDISKDGIIYAEKNFPNCQFFTEAIDPKNLDKKYDADLICAFEFYPFTRTSQIEYHRSFLKYILDRLNYGGKFVIIQLWTNPESLAENYERLAEEFSEYKFSSYVIPYNKIYSLLKNLTISALVSETIFYFLHIIVKKNIGKNKIIIIEKPEITC